VGGEDANQRGATDTEVPRQSIRCVHGLRWCLFVDLFVCLFVCLFGVVVVVVIVVVDVIVVFY
jgi:hypothetical protein